MSDKQIYGRNDMVAIDQHNKIYGSLGIAEPFVYNTVQSDPPLTMQNCREGSFNKEVTEFSIYGKSVQKTTTGVQLLDYKKLAKDSPYIYSVDEDNLILQCSDGRVWSTAVPEYGILPAGTYYASFAGMEIIRASDNSAVFVGAGTFTISEDTSVKIKVNIPAGQTEKYPIAVKPMLNAGTTPLPWEPYTGGKPSPSPDYPQEIESVGMKWSTGANLLDPSKFAAVVKTYGLDIDFDENGNTDIHGTFFFNKNMGEVNYAMFRFIMAKNKMSFPDGAKYAINVTESSGASGIDIGANSSLSENYPSLVIAFYAKNGEEVHIKLQSMVYIGDTVPEWEPYTGGIPKPYGDKIRVQVSNEAAEPQSMSIPTPNGLPGIPVPSGGNYTDSSGQQWTCDEIDFARGVYVQRINELTFDQLTFSHETTSVNHNDTFIAVIDEQLTGTEIGYAMCQYAFFDGVSYELAMQEDCRCYVWKNNVTIQFRYSVGVNTLEIFAEWLSSHPNASISYVLKTPIETPLTADQLAAYKQLHTYKGTTIVDNDAGARTKITYKASGNKLES